MILKGYIFGILYAFICLALALVAYKLGMPKKYSRKLVHILVGAEWIILSHYMGPTYHFLVVCLIFFVLLAVSHFMHLMPMISSESDNAPGTVYYALAMSIMATICLYMPDLMLPFGIGVFCTSFGDGFAGVVGQLIKKYNPKVYGNKTAFGVLANFLFSSGVAILFMLWFDMNIELWHCFMIGALSAGLELITVFGLDNVTITLGTAFLAYSFIRWPLVELFVLPIIITPFIIALVIEKKVLTRNGLILAMILDAVVSLTLGNFGFVLLAAFLFGSVIIDKIKRHAKKDDGIVKKGDCRDGIQVIANGLVPMMMALFYSLTYNEIFVFAYVAALAEAFADTAASGIGAFSSSVFDIFKMKRTKPGLSGGVSVIGTVAAFIAPFFISLIAFLFGVVGIEYFVLISVAAFIGVMVDSMLGSLLQIKLKCPVCGEITEREVHCKKLCKRYSGFAFFDNDIVNLFSGAFAAILIAVVAYLI